MEKDQVFKLRIDKKTHETLNNIAQVEGVSKSEMVRQLIHQAVNQSNKQSQHQVGDCVEATR
ncbi:MAG: ribbon-helix-helix domain-containing protein [Anaerolineaceae bacterium]|nr:ribbon-helix-helix domain-containing protein [Anaerolineaceae bacterium]